MQDFINTVRSVITEASGDDYAHDATNIANSHSQHANTKQYHKQASEKHQFAYDRHSERQSIVGVKHGKYHGLLMQHHKNMMAYHDSQLS
jgi:hypothetical protein